MEQADNCIFISGTNLLEIKKSNNLLKIYTEEWNIEKNKISVIFNKITKNSIDNKILKIIFSDYNIIRKNKIK